MDQLSGADAVADYAPAAELCFGGFSFHGDNVGAVVGILVLVFELGI